MEIILRDYYFVGLISQVGDQELKEFGQDVTFPEELAHEAILGGCGLITVDQYMDLELSVSDLAAIQADSGNLPASLAKKKKQAHDYYRENVALLTSGESLDYPKE